MVVYHYFCSEYLSDIRNSLSFLFLEKERKIGNK